MSEAKQLYDDILCALSPLLPRTVYQDVRRVRTLAWAITGLCLLHSVRLSAWAEVVKPPDPERRAPGPALLGALLHHPAVVPAQWYRPVIQAALSGWPVEQHLFLAPSYDRAVVLRADPGLPAVSWPGDSSRVAGHAPQEYERLSFEACQPVLGSACVPSRKPGQVITLRGPSWLSARATA